MRLLMVNSVDSLGMFCRIASDSVLVPLLPYHSIVFLSAFTSTGVRISGANICSAEQRQVHVVFSCLFVCLHMIF
jgi:hypothetical protein